MQTFADKVINAAIPQGEIGVFFLGQAGFILKTPRGELIAVDPYLSDCCNRYFGFKRLMPYLLSPEELTFDYLVASHAHYDHFDPDSVPALMANEKTQFIGALDTAEECEKLGINERVFFIGVGDKVALGSVTLTAVRCDHGTDTPHAVGLLFETEGKKIYVMGDTAYRPEWLSEPRLQGVDLLILPINGTFGNLNEKQAAQVIDTLKPKLAIPCHFWNFAQHFGSPALFMEEMKNICPNAEYLFLRQGEDIII